MQLDIQTNDFLLNDAIGNYTKYHQQNELTSHTLQGATSIYWSF